MNYQYNRTPIETELKVVNMYNSSNISMKEVANKLNLNPSTVRNILKRHNVNTKKLYKLHHRKYNVNDNYFENIDSHTKAYILGFLYADGYLVIEGNGTKRIGIDLIDKNILEKIAKEIEFEGEVVDISNKKSGYKSKNKLYRLKITSPKIYEDLIKLGCLENKTHCLSFPSNEQVRYEYLNSFILGYMDGDGTIACSKRKTNGNYPEYYVGFTGNKDLLNGIQSYFHTNKKLYKRWKDRDDDIHDLRFCGNIQSYKILKMLYMNSELYLERKYEKFKQLEKLIVDRNSNITS